MLCIYNVCFSTLVNFLAFINFFKCMKMSRFSASVCLVKLFDILISYITFKLLLSVGYNGASQTFLFCRTPTKIHIKYWYHCFDKNLYLAGQNRIIIGIQIWFGYFFDTDRITNSIKITKIPFLLLRIVSIMIM